VGARRVWCWLDEFGLGTDRTLAAFPRYSMVGSSADSSPPLPTLHACRQGRRGGGFAGEYHLEIQEVELSDDARVIPLPDRQHGHSERRRLQTQSPHRTPYTLSLHTAPSPPHSPPHLQPPFSVRRRVPLPCVFIPFAWRVYSLRLLESHLHRGHCWRVRSHPLHLYSCCWRRLRV
jgi:hypothetical protein